MKRRIVPTSLLAPLFAEPQRMAEIGADVGVVAADEIRRLRNRIGRAAVETEQSRRGAIAAGIDKHAGNGGASGSDRTEKLPLQFEGANAAVLVDLPRVSVVELPQEVNELVVQDPHK